MKKTHNTVQKKLSEIQMKPLNQKEADLVWEHIRFNMNRTTPHARKSPFSLLKKSIAITLIFGLTTGTAFAADNAKPGDALFPVDRALENIQLSLASGNNKDALKVKFALERVTEVKDILSEVATQQTDTSIKIAPPVEEITPEVAPDENDGELPVAKELPAVTQKSAELPAEETPTEETQDDIADDTQPADTDAQAEVDTPEETPAEEIQKELPAHASGTPATIKSASSSKDALQKEISDNDKKRIELALGTALSFLGDVKGELAEQGNTDAVEYIDVMLAQINKDIGTLPSEVAFEVHVSAKKERVSFEVTSQDNKPTLNIEVKDEEPATEPEDGEAEVAAKEAPTKAKPKPTESKLEIKDGEIKITKTSEEPEDSGELEDTSSEDTREEDTLPENENASSSEDVIEDSETASSSIDKLPGETEPTDDDGTTSVKVIFKKLNEDFEFTVSDQNASIHDIIDDHTEDKPEDSETAS